jgi:hypothetical protein
VDLAAVLDRKRRKVRIRGEVAPCTKWLDETAKDREMAVCRMEDPRARLREPVLHEVKGVGWRERTREYLRTVESRTNARSTVHAKPTGSLPESRPSSQGRARS